MKVYAFGEPDAPAIVLLPGTCCDWKGNFEAVIPLLKERYRVLCVSYDGFETEQALGKDKQISHDDKKKVKEDIAALRKAVHKTKPESITTEQAAEIARLAEALKESAKKIQPES